MSLNILLISDTILKERSVIHDNNDSKQIYPDIKYAQDFFIKPILGSALYDRIQSLIQSGDITLSANADYKLLLDDYIIDALIYYTMSLLPMSSSYQFWNKGVLRKQGVDTELPSMTELVEISKNYQNRAENYGNRLKLFLLDQTSRLQKYPEYVHPGSTVDTVTPSQKQFTMPIYLGEDWDDPWCNKGGFNGQPYKP